MPEINTPITQDLMFVPKPGTASLKTTYSGRPTMEQYRSTHKELYCT